MDQDNFLHFLGNKKDLFLSGIVVMICDSAYCIL